MFFNVRYDIGYRGLVADFHKAFLLATKLECSVFGVFNNYSQIMNESIKRNTGRVGKAVNSGK